MDMDYFEKLKDEMSYQDITQKELSEKTGISINTIRGWFSKKVHPDLDSAYKIAQTLKQPLEYFLSNDPFLPNNFHLPSREIELLENYRKLSDKEKKTIDLATQTLASDYKEPVSDIF